MSDPTAVIVGQGYVGLPLAVAAAKAGYSVSGVDLDPTRVEALNAGESHIDDVSAADLADARDHDRYRATTDFAVVSGADVVVICVPTPYKDQAPDMSHIEAAVGDVGDHLKAGTLVILESTTYPGTTEEVVQPILEERSGLRAGEDFHLAFSPERINPGDPHFGIHNTPKIVGGLTEEGTDRAAAFYGSFVEQVHRVSGPKAAEMAKLLENTFRHINIALVNELAMLARDLGVDIWEVVDAAATKPFGFMPFYPGPGVGGHCIPVDPMYLSWRVKQFGGSAKFIDLARDVNAAMPLYCVTRIQELLNDQSKPLKGSRVLVVGVAYKPNIGDMRESPALDLIEGLVDRGADVHFHDPFVQQLQIGEETLQSVPLEGEIEAADVVTVVTAHDGVDYGAIAAKARAVFDTRNVVPSGENVYRL